MDGGLALSFFDWFWHAAGAVSVSTTGACSQQGCSGWTKLGLAVCGPSLRTTVPHIVLTSKEQQKKFLVRRRSIRKHNLPAASNMKDLLSSLSVNAMEVRMRSWINSRNKPRAGWLPASRMVSQVQPVNHPVQSG